MANYAFGKSVAIGHEEAVARVTQELAKEGFGVLTEIDVAATLQKKLGVQMSPYRILGACNPQLAHRALQADPRIGALLPCNIVVRTGERGGTIVEAMDPAAVLSLVDLAEIEPIAAQVRERLERVIAAV